MDFETRSLIKNKYNFCKQGSTDLYIAFFEESLTRIKKDGIVAFITPNSFLRNVSGSNFREWLTKNHFLLKFIDFGNHQVFDGYLTYTSISILQANARITKYFKYENNKINFIKNLELQDYHQGWYFNLNVSKERVKKKPNFSFDIKYGLATLRDKIYISNVDKDDVDFILFNGFLLEKKATIPIIKASLTLQKQQRIIFPYQHERDKIIPLLEDELKNAYPLCYNYLLHHKDELIKRKMDSNAKFWYQYGRSQGIQSIFKNKIAISNVIKECINITPCNSETAVYSGITLVSDELDFITKQLKTKEFLEYIKAVGKDIQGGYKTFNANQVKIYLEAIDE